MASPYLSNNACQVCGTESAVHYCECQCSDSLCSTCLTAHQAKFPFIPHYVLPITARTDPETYKRKAAALVTSIKALRENIDKLTQCEEELVKTVEAAVTVLVQYQERLKRQLRAEKDKIEAVVEAAAKEANEYLAGGPEPINSLAKAIWTLPIEQFAVVHFSVTPPDLELFTQSWVSYRNNFDSLLSSLSTSPSPLYIEPTRAKVFNSATSGWDCYPLRTPVCADVGTRYVWAGVELFCCGGSS